MNKICKKYIYEIRALFPIKTRSERRYLKKLASDVDTYCTNESISSKQDLYQIFGTPQEVTFNYVSALDTKFIIKRLRFTKFIKAAMAVILITATIATTAFAIDLHKKHEFLDIFDGSYVEEVLVIYGKRPDSDNTNKEGN